MMRTSGEGRQRLLALMSVMVILIGGTIAAGRLAPKRSSQSPSVDLTESDSPLSAERKEKLRQLQDVVSRLRAKAREEDWDAVIKIADRDIHRSGLLRALKAEALARQGHHQAAIAILNHLYKTHSDPTLFLLTGRRAEYEQLVAKDLRAVDLNPKSAGANVHAAWIASLDSQPRSQADYIRQLAERGVSLSEVPVQFSNWMTIPSSPTRRNTGQPDRADALRVLGTTLFRQGKYAEAVESLTKSEGMRPTPHLWAFLSLSYRKLGNNAEADTWDSKLRRYMNQTFGAQSRPTEFYLYLRELDAAKPV